MAKGKTNFLLVILLQSQLKWSLGTIGFHGSVA